MIAHWDHEPLERGCVEDQPQQSRSGNMLRLVDDDTAALRFLESLRDFMIAHWAHEPPERGCVEDQPQQSRSGNVLRLVDDDTAALRFMERAGMMGEAVRLTRPSPKVSR